MSLTSTARLRLAIAFTAGALALGVAGAAGAAAAPAAGGHCPATQISKVWYGGEQDSWSYQACGDLAEWFGHLYYPGTMLSTAHAPSYRTDVVVVQLRLRDLNYRPMGVDGSYGAQTAAAITRYQRNHGLVVDGKVGVQTWRALFGLGSA